MLVAEHLCVHDPRAMAFVQGDEEAPRGGCACDRCWSGRDDLAVALQEALDLVEECRDQIRSQPLSGNDSARRAFVVLRCISDLQARYEPLPPPTRRPPA
jgi:hypothetical protein